MDDNAAFPFEAGTHSTTFRSLKLGYRYEFSIDELDAAQACVEAHGFAIVKGVLSDALVEELQESVKRLLDPDDTLGRGQQFHPHLLYRTFTCDVETVRP